MNTSNTHARHLRSTVGTIVMALVFTSVIGGISPVPALGQENERRQRQQRPGQQQAGPQRPEPQRPERREGGWRGRERQDTRGWRGREWQDARGRRGREWQDNRGRRRYEPYGYVAPLYVPPPVIYVPPLPGISLFFR